MVAPAWSMGYGQSAFPGFGCLETLKNSSAVKYLWASTVIKLVEKVLIILR